MVSGGIKLAGAENLLKDITSYQTKQTTLSTLKAWCKRVEHGIHENCCEPKKGFYYLFLIQINNRQKVVTFGNTENSTIRYKEEKENQKFCNILI